jgi:hypothetical protein
LIWGFEGENFVSKERLNAGENWRKRLKNVAKKFSLSED